MQRACARGGQRARISADVDSYGERIYDHQRAHQYGWIGENRNIHDNLHHHIRNSLHLRGSGALRRSTTNSPLFIESVALISLLYKITPEKVLGLNVGIFGG